MFIKKILHDEDIATDDILSIDGINKDKDIAKVYRMNDDGNYGPEFDLKIKFVGFIIDSDGVVISLPKKYKFTSNKDAKKVFSLIKNFRQHPPYTMIGHEKNDAIDSNYPFYSFFRIYDYYKRNGLYLENNYVIKEGINGKVDWKNTISKSLKYIVGDDLIFIPYYSRKKYHFNNFITYCMADAINTTYSIFSDFFDIEMIENVEYDAAIFSNSKSVVEILTIIKEKTFNDVHLALIDDLITFYKSKKNGVKYYLKNYTFSSIWEEMTRFFISQKVSDYDNTLGFVYGTPALSFSKKIFHPNAANPQNFISVDSYAESGKKQYIIDAKYYEELKHINYKQICYSLFLKDNIDETTGLKKYDSTYSILLLPDDNNHRNVHFKMKPHYLDKNSDIIVQAEYLDINEVINFYLLFH